MQDKIRARIEYKTKQHVEEAGWSEPADKFHWTPLVNYRDMRGYRTALECRVDDTRQNIADELKLISTAAQQ